MKSLQQRLLKTLWKNQTSVIKSPGRAVNVIEIIKAGKVWAEQVSITPGDQDKAINAANEGRPFDSIIFDCY